MGLSALLPIVLVLFGVAPVSAQVKYTFTNAGATGVSGPSQTQADNAYSSTSLDGKVFVLNGIQHWIVPLTGYYKITTRGAQGGSISLGCTATGGLGAEMTGEFLLTGGDTLKILVGQQGTSNTEDAGGGGGTFITTMDNTPLIIAGGGGGATNNIGNCGSNLNGVDA
ncbi:MAG TPA: glycine-rich protein, partial [Bacteroidia bacterium]|nr:glycine-rich protein [Bacteroidia bacterium]